jgi:hypothetical protein
VYFAANDGPGSRFDPEFSIRDFFIDQTSGYAYFLDQALYIPRTRFSMLKTAAVYLPFNMTFGHFFKDAIRPEYQVNIRDGSSTDYVWEWDPMVPIMCNGPHEVFLLAHEQYHCGCKICQLMI